MDNMHNCELVHIYNIVCRILLSAVQIYRIDRIQTRMMYVLLIVLASMYPINIYIYIYINDMVKYT